jgi:hypothetical protein
MSKSQQEMELIQQLEDVRYVAMVDKDVHKLDGLLDDELIYVHSTGVADTKSSYVDGLRNGAWDYQSIDRTDPRIQVDKDIALVFCKLSIRMVSHGEFRAFDSRVLAVWVRRTDNWRLLAVQSGAIPGKH